MNTYVLVYLCSWLLALLVTPIVIRLARRFKMVDSSDIRKVHSRPVPRIGGVAVFVPMMVLTISVLFLNNDIGDKFHGIQPKIIVLLSAAAFMFLVGLIDDIKGLRARVKFLCQLAAAITVCAFGIRITSIAVSDWFTLNLGWFSWPLTLFWIVGVTNAVNLIDGLDGLAAGISAIACGVMVVLALYFGQPVMAVIMLSLCGALTGFLFFNFNPAKVFMGDCGSLFLGFTLASASVMCATKSHAIVGLTLPIIALGIPILDTLFSMLRRFLERRSIFSPDRSHFHHRLLALGLHQRHVVIVAYAVTLLIAGLGMFMIFTRNAQTIIIFVCILFLLVLAFRVVGSVQLHKTIADLKRKHRISHHTKQEVASFEKVGLHFRQVKTFEQWWQTVCFAADQMGFVRGWLPLTNRDGTNKILAWGENGKDTCGRATPRYDIVKMTLPVRDRRAGPPLNLEIEVHAYGSLESAGRRIALFGRLIEKYGIATLPNKTKNTPILAALPQSS